MSDLTDQLWAEIRKMDWEESVTSDVVSVLSRAADALDAAEAKLAAIDALHRVTGDGRMEVWCSSCGRDSSWPCPTHRILHPETSHE